MNSTSFWSFVGDHALSLASVGIGFIATALYGFNILSTDVTIGTILFILSLLATTEIVERNKRLTKIETLLDEKGGVLRHEEAQQLQETLLRKVTEEADRAIRALDGVEIREFKTHNEFIAYAAQRVLAAKQSVDVTHLSFAYLPSSPEGKAYYEALEKLILSDQARVRRVVAIDNMTTWEWVKSTLERYKDTRFLLRYYSPRTQAIPVMNLMIFDGVEVCTGGGERSPGSDPVTLSIKHPAFVRMIKQHFETLWSLASELNEYGTRYDRLEEIKRKLPSTNRDVLIGGEIVIHRGREQFTDYIIERIKRAAHRIDIVSPSTFGKTLYQDKETRSEYLAAIKDAAVSRKVRVRRVRGLHNSQVLRATVDEIKEHLGAEFYLAAYPLQNIEEAPFLSVMIVDDEVAIGGIRKAASEDVLTVTSTHPLILETVSDYFDTLWKKSAKLNTRKTMDQHVIQHLEEALLDELEYIDSAAQNFLQSAEIIASAKRRVWVTSSLSYGDNQNSQEAIVYDAMVEKLLHKHPEVEFRRILRASNEENLDKQLELAKTKRNVPNYLLRYVLDQRPAIDCLIRDDDIILIGLRDRESSFLHDSVILVRNKTFVRAVASWYERYLWPYAITVKDGRGIVESGVEQVRKALREQFQGAARSSFAAI